MADMIDMSTGRAYYASTQQEWHIGHTKHGVLRPDASMDEWLKATGLDFQIKRAKIRYATTREAGLPGSRVSDLNEVDDKVVLFRGDTGAPLSVVSAGYKIVQPREMLEVFREWAERGGVSIESAGVLFDGKRYFATGKVAAAARDTVGKGDYIDNYILFSSSADQSLNTEGRPTAVRTVCANTMAIALGDKACFKKSHRSIYKADDAKAAVEGAIKDFGAYMQMARALAGLRVRAKEAEELTTALFTTAARDADAARASAGFNKVLSLFSGSALGAGLETSRETGWGWLNAVTEYVDHHARAHSDDNRLVSAIWGPGNDLKNRAKDLVYGTAA